MRVLVLNCGSATLKFQLIELDEASGSVQRDRKLARGLVERIGGAASVRFEAETCRPLEKQLPIGDHEKAVGLALDWLSSVPELSSFNAVGHRIVHGGHDFAAPAWVDDHLLGALDSLCELAPLHNPAGVAGIRAARRILGEAMPMVAAFDTSFHHTLPEVARSYAIPHELAVKHAIWRYGFHGLAHQYSVMRYGELTEKAADRINIITLHLGNGCSACAVRAGISVDISMGFTPLEGLVMGTRSGDVDPAVVPFLARREGVGADEVENWLNKRSGLLGVSGVSNDIREVIGASEQNARARLALDLFCYRARKYLGAYLAVLGGAEAVVFSGGIGENSPRVREQICAEMVWCGLKLDAAANAETGSDRCISSSEAHMKAYVIHTDEERIIARETAQTVSKRRGSRPQTN